MKDKILKFETAYKLSLQECLAEPDETALQHGYELGRQAVRNGMGVMDIISIHKGILLSQLSQATNTDECINIVKVSQDLFIECLAPFELTHRGFIELESLNLQLEALNKELESFSYSVSHDLKAPLRAITGFVQIILKTKGDTFDADTLSRFNIIKTEASRMGKLIDDLLSFSRMGKKQMTSSDLDMGAIVQDVWEEIQIINPGREIVLVLDSIPAARGDRTLIRQVFYNLLSNAVKFTRRSADVRIEVGGRRDDEADPVFFVKDNGVGFDMANRNKLFCVFQRLHTSTEFEGTGIGLAIVQRIIHRHGGSVRAEGETGKGATFYFTLPGIKSD